MLRVALTILLAYILTLASPGASSQTAPASTNLPIFDAATIKPPDPAARYRMSGFYGKPGGRVFFGGNIKMLVMYAFNFQDYQISGGPGWASSQWFEINAVPPDTSPTLNIKVQNANPTTEQRLMLQSLLRDRFGFKYHFESKEGGFLILMRGTKPLQFKPPKDPAADPRAIVMIKSSGIDGEALGGEDAGVPHEFFAAGIETQGEQVEDFSADNSGKVEVFAGGGGDPLSGRLTAVEKVGFPGLSAEVGHQPGADGSCTDHEWFSSLDSGG